MLAERNTYFRTVASAGSDFTQKRHQQALERCLDRLRRTMPVIGLRNPKIGLADNTWSYCGPYDWVVSFLAGQYWLALGLTGDPVFLNAARARRNVFRGILRNRDAQDHDLGFQYSLACVSDWLLTGDREPRDMALEAANVLLNRYHPEGRYIQAWNPRSVHGAFRPEFANGRVIADTMQNLALLYWAYNETARCDFKEAADGHAETTIANLVRPDGTSFHTFLFDPASGKPVRGETHQGHADNSCWSRGQAWMIHGFAQCAATTGNRTHLDTARRLAAKAEELMGDDRVPVWDYSVPEPKTDHRDSSAAAIMAAGLFILADIDEAEEAARWHDFGNRLLDGLLDTCDLTGDPDALGLLAHGAAHVKAGFADTMLPYGDYYFMEALMRSLGHRQFFW
ncbi:glycoside hydrolase family protein [Rhizobium terrae]|uniref:glycoside hydrolase family 88 protein n=1 Tax=Rhizobium terrae TaxID=2171756 RepID=UPI0013C36AA3|nr:glycoside hydrolase family 88 protein [Rhizobium terrae]